MRRKIFIFGVAILVIVSGAPAYATLNPDPDELGIYFDTGADTVCLTVEPYVPFFAYLVITNPTAEEIWAIEFSLCTEVEGGNNSLLFLLNEIWYAGFGDIWPPLDWCLDGRAIGFGEPVPWVGENVVLAQLNYLLLANLGVEFLLGPHPAESIEDGLPAYMDGNNVIVPLGVSSGDPGLPVAAVNGPCDVVPVEAKTFSGLKCLYR